MTRPALVVAIATTVVICIQNFGSVVGFGWGLIHGAGVASVLAFWPAAVGCGLLWAGYVLLKRRRTSRFVVVFTIYALGVLLLNEMILPSTPLRAWRDRRAAESVEIRNIRDELALSARGRPIGIRVTFEAVFPKDGDYRVVLSALGTIDRNLPGALQFGRSVRSTIEPHSDGHFKKGITYRFTRISSPFFLLYDPSTNEPCLAEFPVGFPPRHIDLPSALKTSKSLQYRASILVSKGEAMPARAASYVTSRRYDVEAMYQTIVAEGNKQCPPNPR